MTSARLICADPARLLEQHDPKIWGWECDICHLSYQQVLPKSLARQMLAYHKKSRDHKWASKAPTRGLR